MKERPILFSGPMVTAILEGRKTQTRRIIKPQPSNFLSDMGIYPSVQKKVPMKLSNKKPTLKNDVMPDYDTGKNLEPINFLEDVDRLWVKETWAEVCHAEDGQCYGEECTECAFEYRADKPNAKWAGDWPNEFNGDEVPIGCKWKPSLFMTRHASRINLEVQSIHVEHLQNITREDAISEGVYYDHGLDGYVTDKDGRNFHHSDPRISFCKLWISINGAESWDANPYVWVVNFKKLES